MRSLQLTPQVTLNHLRYILVTVVKFFLSQFIRLNFSLQVKGSTVAALLACHGKLIPFLSIQVEYKISLNPPIPLLQ